VKSWLQQRAPKQCRERWANQLQTADRDKSWTAEEDEQLVQLQEKMGNHWSRIASAMKGRTDNQVKNKWYSTVLKKNAEGLARRETRTLRGDQRKSPTSHGEN
jgi:hypothetical protein